MIGQRLTLSNKCLLKDTRFIFPTSSPAALRNVEPILADNLVDAYKKKVADEGRLFMDEFQVIFIIGSCWVKKCVCLKIYSLVLLSYLFRAFPVFSLTTPLKRRRSRETSPGIAMWTFCHVRITLILMFYLYNSLSISVLVLILADDYNRVVLSTDADNDYINASFIEVQIFIKA